MLCVTIKKRRWNCIKVEELRRMPLWYGRTEVMSMGLFMHVRSWETIVESALSRHDDNPWSQRFPPVVQYGTIKQAMLDNRKIYTPPFSAIDTQSNMLVSTRHKGTCLTRGGAALYLKLMPVFPAIRLPDMRYRRSGGRLPPSLPLANFFPLRRLTGNIHINHNIHRLYAIYSSFSEELRFKGCHPFYQPAIDTHGQ